MYQLPGTRCPLPNTLHRGAAVPRLGHKKKNSMNERLRKLMNDMNALEGELRTALHEQEERMFFQIKGKRVEFERNVRDAHLKLKRNFFRW